MPKIDIWLVIIIILLSFFSLLNLLGIKQFWFYNQLIFLFIGLLFFIIIAKIDFLFFKDNDKLIFLFLLFLLLLSYFFVPEIRGSKRWIDLYFFNLQLSEVIKPFFIISLAKTLSEKKQKFFVLIIYLLPIIIIFKQPDLGNAIVYFSIFLAMLFFSRVSLKYFYLLNLFLIFFFPMFWHFLADYQKDRLISFLKPELHASDNSYNLIQSIIAVGSGRFFGRGLGLGTQSRLAFLPENHTDFAFASFIEQFGFLGGIVLITLYFFLVWRLMIKIIKYRNDYFMYLFLIGTLFLFLSHISINIGMNLGILPITGITLPILSYGGSSLVTVMIIFGLTSRF